MSTRINRRMTFLAVATSVVIFAPLALAAESPRCAEVAVSALAEPDWYAAECLGGVRPAAPEAAPGSSFGVDLAYIHNVRGAGTFPLSVYTAPIGTLTYTLVGPNSRPIFAVDFDNAASVLWGIDNTTRQLGTYDQTTGVFTPTVVTTGIVGTITGMKFDPTSTTVYVSSATQLFTMDMTTGVATLVGNFTHVGPLIIDIAISNLGQMYGHDIATDSLYSINKATGATTVIGLTGQNTNFAQGMDFDASTDTLYAFMYIGGGVNNLSTFNLATGAATIIVPGPAGPEQEGAMKVAALRLTGTALAVDTAGNQVLDPNETVVVAPTWRNDSSLAVTNVTGTFSTFTGPATAIYNLTDASATYGNIAAGASATCTADCYGVMVSAATRPAVHWDSTVLETLSVAGQNKTWTLHIGGSFADVSPANPFYRFVETILHKNVTGGCTATTYCPTTSTTREQMAVFVLISKEGAGYTPPACAPPNLFSDVPETSPFCRFIEELANRGVVTGCAPNVYCPTSAATRDAMSVFVLRTLDPTLNPPVCAPPNLFADVPETSAFCRWIEELANRGIVTGCGGGNYCPADAVTREQMSVFLAVTFSLTLYGL